MTIRKVALVAGVNSYPTMPLSVCVDDAKEMCAVLSMPEYGYDVETLLNESVTRRQLSESLVTLFRTKAEDYLFYFAGHGLSTDIGVYLATCDADSVEAGIDLDYLKRLITRLAPKDSRVLIILDCCHAGAATARSLSPVVSNTRSEAMAHAVAGLPQGRAVLAACKDDESALENRALGHGIFTYHLLRGLMGEAADGSGIVTVGGLYEYVSACMVESGYQTPVFRGDIVGRSIIGEGLEPRTRPIIPEERLKSLEREAQQHLQNYQALIAPNLAQLDIWKESGHKAACQALEPILNWFERRMEEYPQLKTRKSFSDLYNALIQRLSSLSSIDIGTELLEGVVEKRLGAGTFGTVWKVNDLRRNSAAAYKVYHPTDFNEDEKIGRFKRGYEAMRQLDHPHIVKVFSLTQCPLGFYMEYIDGPNLRNFTGTLEEPLQIIPILYTVADTLKHAHLRNVVHRDVKPENIILRHDGAGGWQPYLTDFDLAWYSTASKLTKDAFGTVQYSAPEQMATPTAASAHAPTTDAYSFGQLCYYAVTGSDPVPLEYANNYRALEIRLRGGWVVSAAHQFMNLYAECTEHKFDKRPSFNIICDRLFKIIQLLRNVRPSELLTEDRFIQELIFSMVGINTDVGESDRAFITISGKTRVAISTRALRHNAIDLTLDFQSQHALMIEGAASHEEARRIVFAKVSSATSSYVETRMRKGSYGSFQFFIDVNSISPTFDGIEVMRSLLTRVIETLESV